MEEEPDEDDFDSEDDEDDEDFASDDDFASDEEDFAVAGLLLDDEPRLSFR